MSTKTGAKRLEAAVKTDDVPVKLCVTITDSEDPDAPPVQVIVYGVEK